MGLKDIPLLGSIQSKIKEIAPKFNWKDYKSLSGVLRFVFDVWEPLTRFSHTVMSRNAAALGFYTLFSFVPCLAVIIWVLKNANMNQQIIEWATNTMQSHGLSQNLITDFVGFANNYMSDNTEFWKWVLAVLMLAYTITSTYFEIERLFKEIWGQKSTRPLHIQFCIASASLIFLALYICLWFYIHTSLSGLIDGSYAAVIYCTRAVECFVFFFVFVFIFYTAIPQGEVNRQYATQGAALTAGILTAFTLAFFVLAKMFSYTKIYGQTVASIFILLLYVQILWAILLYGAHFTYAKHCHSSNKDIKFFNDGIITNELNNLSHEDKEAIFTYVFHIICKKYGSQSERKEIQQTTIADLCDAGVPVQVAFWAVEKLAAAKLIAETKDGMQYLPYNPEAITTADFLHIVNSRIGDAVKEKYEADKVMTEKVEQIKAEIAHIRDIRDTNKLIKDMQF